ncbi:MAG: right-handed parallel beta-helix repeat-containing protein [Planctomycetia bacterium]|nr:right-handed parallel beta-helix repeat-containing protein [Planctomycetia bacterium]
MNRLLLTVCVALSVLISSGTLSAMEKSTEKSAEKNTVNTQKWAEPALVQEVLDGKRTEARVSWWGFDAEDSTQFIQAAISSGVPKLWLDRQESEWVTMPLQAVSNQEIIVEDGTVLLAKRGEFHGKVDALIRISQCENVILRGEKGYKGSTLRMWKCDYQNEPYSKSEWRHAVSILSSKNVLIQDLTIEKSGGDGIYLGVSKRGMTNTDVTIRRVDCNENHRQGISVISARNLLIEETLMRNTSGTAPQAGIDFEPNAKSEELTNCVMRNCLCEGNASCGYAFYLPNMDKSSHPLSITLENCVSKNNGSTGLYWTLGASRDGGPMPEPAHGTFTVKNFTTIGDRHGWIFLRNNLQDSVKVTFDGVKIQKYDPEAQKDETVPTVKSGQSPIVIRADQGCTRAVGSVNFSDVTILPGFDVKPFHFMNMSEEGWGMAAVTGKITTVNGDSREELVLTQEWLQENYPIRNTRRLPTVPISVEKLIPVVKNMVENKAENVENVEVVEKLPFMPVRHRARWFLVVREAGKITTSVRMSPVNGTPDAAPANFHVSTQNGETVCETQVPIMTEYQDKNGKTRTRPGTAEITFSAEKPGIYVLEAKMDNHAAAIERCTVPVAVDATRINWLRGAGDLYFYLPPGTQEIGLCVRGFGAEPAHVEVWSPSGEKVVEKDMISETEFFYPDSATCATGGVWKIRFLRPSEGCFEDSGFTLQNVLPILSFQKEALLKEKK